MRLWQFGRLQGSKIRIDEDLGQYLGLVNGSQAFSTMFRYDHGTDSSYEIVLSTFGPENYRQLCDLTIYMIDRPGSCAQASKFLSDRNIDILNSVSLSMISNVCMVWKMLADLSYYGEPSELKAEFDALKKGKSGMIDKVDTLDIIPSNISDRYTKGAAADSASVRTKVVRKKQKGASTIKGSMFEVPPEYLETWKGVKDGQPLMMVADLESHVLSITFLAESTKLVRLGFIIPDKPGAINQISETLYRHEVNMVSVSTKVRVYYESMYLDIIADVSKCDVDLNKLKASVEEVLTKLKGSFQLTAFEPIDL